MVPEDGQPGVFSVIVHLPPGYDIYVMLQSMRRTLNDQAPDMFWPCRYHQYKFIVDGEWRHDEAQPFMPDPLGNVNNWLFVRKPEMYVALSVDVNDEGLPLINVFLPQSKHRTSYKLPNWQSAGAIQPGI